MDVANDFPRFSALWISIIERPGSCKNADQILKSATEHKELTAIPAPLAPKPDSKSLAIINLFDLCVRQSVFQRTYQRLQDIYTSLRPYIFENG